MSSGYASFEDPIGLVRRMLASGDRSARWALGLAALRPLVAPVDRWWARHEARALTSAPAVAAHPLVLVVGGSRSGTTMAYELLAGTTDVSYVSNLTALFPRSPIVATVRLGGLAGAPTTASYYGQTTGLGGTNDGFALWDRWLGHDRYRPAPPDDRAISAMRTFFAAWTAALPRPFLNKNNRNTLVMTELAAALPTAHFVVVRRDRTAVVRSLLHARAVIQGDVRRTWGLDARGPGTTVTDHVEATYRQVVGVEEAIAGHLGRVDPARVTVTRYEEICATPAAFVRDVATTVGLRVDDNAASRLTAARPSMGQPLRRDEEHRLARLTGVP